MKTKNEIKKRLGRAIKQNKKLTPNRWAEKVYWGGYINALKFVLKKENE